MIKIIIKITQAIITLLALLTLISCEDVVEIPLDTAAPRLVIDAAIKWEKGTTGENQIIRLTKTSNFYSNENPPASGATVTITHGATIYSFIEIPGTGNYQCTNFVPILNDSYTLTVQYEGQNYTATDQLYPTPSIDTVQQSTITGFGGTEIIEIKFFFQDDANMENYYLEGVQNSQIAYPEYSALEDTFFQGNQMFGIYIDEDLEPNDALVLSVQGISKRYFNYMSKLLNLAGSQGGGPFSTPPATLRGNIINTTNESNFPYGYFSLGEIAIENYTVQ